jgi:thymidine phosphorylase
VPQDQSRAITSPAGTADTMEVLAEVELPLDRLQQIVRETRGCLAWGGTADLSPADDILISVERPLAIDSPGQMVASILSKKIAAGSTHLVLDIPVGPTAKVRSMPEAQRLKKLFEYVASAPGPAAGRGDHRRPPAHRPRHRPGAGGARRDAGAGQRPRRAGRPAPEGAALAGRVIEFDPDVRGGDGWRIARDILESGRALAQMNAIIDAQGRRRDRLPAPLTVDVRRRATAW